MTFPTAMGSIYGQMGVCTSANGVKGSRRPPESSAGRPAPPTKAISRLVIWTEKVRTRVVLGIRIEVVGL